MKRVLLNLLLTASLASGAAAFAQGVTPVSPEAKLDADRVMNTYFDSLKNGDTGALNALLGGELGKKRARLLNNPNYAGFLASTYANAQFQVLGYSSTGPGSLEADVLITLSQDEHLRKAYQLSRTGSGNGAAPYRIVGERSLATPAP